MSKGKSSGSAIKRIEHQITLFISSWNPAGNSKARNTTAHAWPALLQLAALRGEAVLRLRFFDHFMPGLPIQHDAEQALALWHQLVETSGVIEDFVNRVGLATALKQEAALPEQAAQEARKLYGILCEALDRHAPELLQIGVDQLLEHQWKQQFSAQSAPTMRRKPTPADLRDQLTLALRRHHKTAAEIRESFVQNNDEVAFKILFRKTRNEPWAELVSLTRPRLTTARLAAFEAALKKP